MGYRNYIGYLPKREYNKIKSLTLEELYNYYGKETDDRYIGVYEFGKELYEFGKYVDFHPPKASIKKFFKKKETQDEFECDHELYTVSKEFLEYIIGNYTEKVQKYYNQMLSPFFIDKEPGEFLNTIKRDHSMFDPTYTFDFSKITPKEQTALFQIIEHVRSMGREWGVMTFLKMIPYDLTKGDEVTISWKYEYGQFELVRIYKSFDWKRNVMIYYGY